MTRRRSPASLPAPATLRAFLSAGITKAENGHLHISTDCCREYQEGRPGWSRSRSRSHSRLHHLPLPSLSVCLKNKETQPALRSLPKTITSCRSHQACDFPALKPKGAFLQEREGSCAGFRIYPLPGEVVSQRDPCHGSWDCSRTGCSLRRRKTVKILICFWILSVFLGKLAYFSWSREIADACFQRESLNRSRAGAPAWFSVLRRGMQGHLSWHHTAYSTRLL